MELWTPATEKPTLRNPTVLKISQIAVLTKSLNFLDCDLAGRFHDDDDDLAGMESSYKQIEKEEVKR